VIRTHPFNLNYYANWIEAGNHTLIITAEDDVGNKTEKEINFTLSALPEPPSVTWTHKERVLRADNFPKMMILKTFKLDQIKEVVVYIQKNGGEKQVLTTISDLSKPVDDMIGFDWKTAPDAGNYTLTAEPVLKSGGTANGDYCLIGITI
jgi:hypothetical protein